MRKSNPPRGLPIDGLLLLDKPAGHTSNRALQQAKNLLQARKAGHTGSLDPMATGLLLICLGQATKLCESLLAADKSYRVKLRLGQETDTGDCEGQVIAEHPVEVSKEQVLAALEKLRAQKEQIPPMFSALKHKGQPLYRLARQGVEIERKPRPVTLHALDLEAFDPPGITLSLRCSSGYYVRTLATDLGREWGCGAHVAELVRSEIGPFSLNDAITLEDLEKLEPGAPREARVLSIEQSLQHLPALRLPASLAFYFLSGKTIKLAKPIEPGQVRVYGDGEQLIGLGEATAEQRLKPLRAFK